MRLLRIPLVLAGVHTAAVAQTNTTSEARPLTLPEAIEMALKHNLDLQIDRYNPMISLYGLKANYGDYDPTLNLQGSHTHNEAGSQLLGGGFTIPGSVSDYDSFNGDLGGKAPWGMTYDLQGNATDTYGHSFRP